MASIVVKYMIDNDQPRGKYRKLNLRKYLTALVIGTREIVTFPQHLLAEKLETEEVEEDFEPGVERKKAIEIEPSDEIEESIKATIFVPHISKEGKNRLTEIFDQQGLFVNIDRISDKELERYLVAGEKFAVPENKAVARVEITGIPPADYSPLDPLADIDTALGLPNYKAEKPHSS